MFTAGALPRRRLTPTVESLVHTQTRSFVVVLALASFAATANAQGATVSVPNPPADAKAVSINLEDLPYPHPVQYLPLTYYGEDVRMAYMDVGPTAAPNGRTVVLLHGMNFFGEVWAPTIEILRGEGYRVIVPDQIGFGRSSKPDHTPYTLNDMARNTKAILDKLGVTKAEIWGHSMGGMVATRFALFYPDLATHLVIENQIGLEDARLTRPWGGFEAAYKSSLARDWVAIRQNFERYFVTWKPEYEKYVLIHYGWTLGGDWPRLARIRASLLQMVYQEPVVYDWPSIKVKTLVIGGEKDGANYPALAKRSADAIPGAQLVLIPNVGHCPHMEAPQLFYPKVLAFLAEPAKAKSN
jgi:pimeloyl-ACP methyl ester carboxylesterase